MVPLADFGGWDRTKELYHQALVEVVPEWRDFTIESTSVYLGARLGPDTDPAGRCGEHHTGAGEARHLVPSAGGALRTICGTS